MFVNCVFSSLSLLCKNNKYPISQSNKLTKKEFLTTNNFISNEYFEEIIYEVRDRKRILLQT